MAQAGQIKHTDFNDLVFEDRNKSYGAYELRKKYSDRILISLLIGMGVVGFVIAIPYISAFISSLSPKQEEVVVPIDWSKMAPPPVDQKEEIIPPPPPEDVAPKQEEAASVEFRTLEMTDQPVERLTTTEDLTVANPGQETNAGTGGDLFSLQSTGDGGTGKIIDEPQKPEIFTIVEVNAEFNGGQAALAEYLQKNINYPQRAKELNIEGKVYLKFVIDEYGNVGNVSVQRGIGYGCDEEAVRVVRKMPRWKPGKQGGRPVKVWFNLPIDFKLN